MEKKLKLNEELAIEPTEECDSHRRLSDDIAENAYNSECTCGLSFKHLNCKCRAQCSLVWNKLLNVLSKIVPCLA